MRKILWVLGLLITSIASQAQTTYNLPLQGDTIIFQGKLRWFNAPTGFLRISSNGNLISSTIGVSDIVNLQTLLDAKSGTNHTHGFSDLTGTGNVLVSTTNYSNPTWITSLAYSKLTGVPDIAAINTSIGLKLNKSDTASMLSAYRTLIDGKANSSHTQAISTIIGLQTVLDGKLNLIDTSSMLSAYRTALNARAALVHNHNDLYYTEAEVTTLLSGKANSSHTHSEADITNLTTDLAAKVPTARTLTINGVTQTLAANRTFTITAIDTTPLSTRISGKLNIADTSTMLSAYRTALNARALSSHNHIIGDVTGLTTALNAKQATLVSGTNIKTINGNSLLGSGNISISGGSSIDTSSLSARINLKLNKNDTVSMLSGIYTLIAGKAPISHTQGIATITGLQTALDGKAPLSHTQSISTITGLQTVLDSKINISDSSSMLSAYRASLNAKVKYTDTATMLSAYRTSLNAKVKYTDTATMLSGYQHSLGFTAVPNTRTITINGTTLDLSANRSFTVTAPATDTVSLSTRINGKVNISDTAVMLTAYKNADNLRLKIADTASMLSPYGTALLARLKLSDTASMLSPLYTAISGKANTSHTHSGSDITSGTIADARLSSNIFKLDAENTITAQTTFRDGNNHLEMFWNGGDEPHFAITSDGASDTIPPISIEVGNTNTKFGRDTVAITGFFQLPSYPQGVLFTDDQGSVSTGLVGIDLIDGMTDYMNGIQMELDGIAATYVKYPDTASMLAGLHYKIGLQVPKTTTITINGTSQDLTTNRSWNINPTDTTSLSTRINARVRYSDTASMLSGYLRTVDTISYSGLIATKLNISDTASMLSSYGTLIGTKSNSASPTFTGTVVLPSTTSIGAITNTELSYVDGVTSGIQGQLDLKAPLASPTFTGTVVLPSTTSIGTVSATELGYVDNVTSAIQTQINSKAATSHTHGQSDVTGLVSSLDSKLSKGVTASSGLIIGDSESDSYLGGMALDSLMLTSVDTALGNTINNIAVAGHTILQQQTAFLADANRATYNWIIVNVGLNDTWNGVETAATALVRYQKLIDTINSINPNAIIIGAAMQPVNGVYTGGSYAKWQTMNDAIMGKGPNKVTGLDYRIDENSWVLNDGEGNLSPLFDVGDEVHTTTQARKKIANIYRKTLNRAGFLSNIFTKPEDEFWNYYNNTNSIVSKTGDLIVSTSATAGSLGVGITSPGAKVHIVNSSATANNIGLWYAGTSTASSGTASSFGITPTFNETGTAANNVFFISPYYQASGSGSHYLIRAGTNSAANASGTHTDKFTVDNAGNVTIAGNLTVTGTYPGGGGSGDVEEASNNVFTGTNKFNAVNLNNGYGLKLFNTSDQTTNTEYGLLDWSSNVFRITSGETGTGTLRNMEISAKGSTVTIGELSGNLSVVDITKAGVYYVGLGVRGSNTNSANIYSASAIYPTINQTGTAGFNGLFISPYLQATGSGDKYLIRAGTNSAANAGGTHTDKFLVDKDGNVTIAGNLTVTGSYPGGGSTDAVPTNGSTNAVESNGVFDALATKVDNTASGTNQVVWLPSPVINNNGTANTLADVTGLSFPVTSGKTYKFKFTIWYSAAVATTGARWTINGPTATNLDYYTQWDTALSGIIFYAGQTGYNCSCTVSTSSASTASNRAIMEGIITASSSGNVIARFSSEVSSSAITANRGFVEYQEMP